MRQKYLDLHCDFYFIFKWHFVFSEKNIAISILVILDSRRHNPWSGQLQQTWDSQSSWSSRKYLKRKIDKIQKTMMQDLYYCQYFKSLLWFSFIVHTDTATTCVNSPILKTVSKFNRKMYLYVPLNPGGCLQNPKFDFYHLWLIWGVQVLKCQIIYKLRECHVLSKSPEKK